MERGGLARLGLRMEDAFALLGRFAPTNTLPEELPAEPWGIFKEWWDLAHAKGATLNPNAMTLATVGADGTPTARVVLCKGMDLGAGYVVFYTNYTSRKGRALAEKPRAALVFHWDNLERQVRIEGPTVRSPEAESDAYFRTRPWESRVGAWASKQSEPLESREQLLMQVMEAMTDLGLGLRELLEKGDAVEVPRPAHWGGTRVWAERVELWLGGPGRVHDRAVWTRELKAEGSGFAGGAWKATRLNP